MGRTVFKNLEVIGNKNDITKSIANRLLEQGYLIEEINIEKPWGSYIRLSNSNAESFIKDFFPGLTLKEAQLGVDEVELSPKILIVSPSQRLSWQQHNRRAERWTFITEGGYYKSETDEQGELNTAQSGDVVQFKQGERHRLVGNTDAYVIVAEIWQHTDPKNLSNEDDIIRIQDDYTR